jgi:hypothetical protein
VLYGTVCAGIATYGSPLGTPVTQTVTDSQGFTHSISFTRPAAVTVYVVIDVTVDPTTFPSDGVTEIVDAIVAYAQNYTIGFNVVSSAIAAQVFPTAPNGVTGVLDVPTLHVLASWEPLNAYTSGVYVANSGNTYQCATSGTSSSGSGPSGSGSGISDGTCTWNYISVGAVPSASTTITITAFQLATISAANVTVNVTNGTP